MGAALLNDVHSRLNPTHVAEWVGVDSVDAVRRVLSSARRSGHEVAVAGGRHAMGGQQFRGGGVVLDTLPLRGVLDFDAERGLVEVAAGTTWPELITYLDGRPCDGNGGWAVAQKQSGVDRVTLGGSVSANVHGRGLSMCPLVGDIESLLLVGPDGELRRCSRHEHRDLFALAVGGYGLFGVIVSVALRLVPRRPLERTTEVLPVARLVPEVRGRVAAGWVYGNAVLATDERSPDAFLRQGVLTFHRPVDRAVTSSAGPASAEDWERLLLLAHCDKGAAFDGFARRELAMSGTVESPDVHHLGEYAENYHQRLDAALGSERPGSEVTAETYVPPERLAAFLDDVASDLAERGVDVIYANVRFASADHETHLPWAVRDVACVVFAIHTEQTPGGLAASAAAVRGLIDRAIGAGGSYFLTYHRHATREQVEAAHPRFRSFLNAKEAVDPGGLLVSDWLDHHRTLLR